MFESTNKNIGDKCPECESTHIVLSGSFWNKFKCENCGKEGNSSELTKEGDINGRNKSNV